MAIVDGLIWRNPDMRMDGWMPVDEVLRRIADRFPLAIVDRERAARIVREELDRLVEVSAPLVILDDWRSMIGRAAYITIRNEVGGPQFGFLIRTMTTTFEIDYDHPEDRDTCRPLLEALAEALEHDIHTEDVVDEDLDD